MGYDRGDSFPFDFEPNMDFYLVQNRKENCHHDHIPFNVKGDENTVFSVGRKLPGLKDGRPYCSSRNVRCTNIPY